MLRLTVFFSLFRQENQKLKELVTGEGAAPVEGEPAEAKEEPAKEETPSVRSKMEVSTPQKVCRYHPERTGVFVC